MKIKQMYSLSNLGTTDIQTPLNTFIESLPNKGKEIKDISYSFDQRGNIQCAVVFYDDLLET